MTSEELITVQAEMVLAADPGVEGYNPRVWAYRNSIKALNWYASVREKLDDPKCAFAHHAFGRLRIPLESLAAFARTTLLRTFLRPVHTTDCVVLDSSRTLRARCRRVLVRQVQGIRR